MTANRYACQCNWKGHKVVALDQRFPERTIYELTEEGLQVGREWLTETIAAPRNEFWEFPAALSFVFGLTPAELLTAPENLATGWGGGGEPRSGGSPI